MASLRETAPHLRINGEIVLTPASRQSAIDAARATVRRFAEAQEASPAVLQIIDTIEPWEVKDISASWGFPERTSVFF
jgi:hypothetical protein